MALTKPAGCALQVVAGALILAGFAYWMNGSALVGIPVLVVGVGLLFLGGLPALR